MTGAGAIRGPRAAAAAFDLAVCEQFLAHEARLLDEARFDAWLALFTADAWYWVPSQPGQMSPRDTISLIYDDRRLLETRVRRLTSPRIYSQEPRSRTSRIVANVTLEETDPDGAACTVRSKFQLLEYRRNVADHVWRHQLPPARARRRRYADRLEACRPRQLRRRARRAAGAVLTRCKPPSTRIDALTAASDMTSDMKMDLCEWIRETWKKSPT